MQKKITAQQFKEEYAAIRNGFGSVKEKLVQIKKELASLNRRANRLYRDGERSLYVELPNEWPKPAFSGLDVCMDNLEGAWIEARDSVTEAVNALPRKKAAK